MKKKLLLTLLAVITAVLCGLSVSACTKSADGMKFKKDGNGYIVTSADKDATEIEIPAEFEGKPVIGIGDKAFYDCEDLKKVTIPDSVTKIGELAFGFCKYLNTVKIGNGVTEIGYRAFFDCERLMSIEIPANVTKIGGRAFDRCESLSSITVKSGNTAYHSVDNCLIETATKTLIAGCKNSVIPADGSVTTIAEAAFFGHEDLKTISIPEGVTEIGYQAFANCNSLTEITLPESLTSLGNSIFFGCERLKEVNIPDNVNKIGKDTFENCKVLETVTIGKSVTEIGETAFYHCDSLTEINYNGTKAEWKNIKKEKQWSDYTGDYTVQCTDGKLNKSGNEIVE